MGLAIVLICALFAGAIIPSTMNAAQKKSSQKKNTKKVLVVYFPQREQQKKQQKKVKKQPVEGLEIKVQPKHRYAAVHVETPFGNPFVTIPSAYQTLDSFMRVNGLVHTESGVIPCYETNGESMDIYIACG